MGAHLKRLTSLFLSSFISAQSPQIIRFIPGIYRENNHHRIDIFNPNDTTLSLARWLLVTRDYSFEFPVGVLLKPRQRLTIAKTQGDIALNRHPNFLIRIPDAAQAGNYAILIDPTGQARTGLYLAPIAQVRFLPDSGTHISVGGKPIPFYLPAETAPIWQYVPWDPDPITGITRIRNQWRYTTSNEEKEKLLYAPLRFVSLYGESDTLGTLLTYEMEVREPCTTYLIERRFEKASWQPIATPPCPPPGRYKFQYYDTTLFPEGAYAYRLSYYSSEGDTILSLPLFIQRRTYTPPFQMRASQGFLRLYVERSQPIKIKVLNRYYEEVLRLYDGWLNGGVENIFTWDPQRYPDVACIVVWTPTRRYWYFLNSKP